MLHLVTTHLRELGLICRPEKPVDRGLSGHLGPHLTGDAAQFEAAVGDGFCVRLHVHAGSTAQRRYRVKGDEEHTVRHLLYHFSAL